ncbi:glycoside hydrolase family 37 protein [Panus rudis PR-1116 ss-1]|nr:glycoside hydrolase family 37 protein [Panus rudis PR-1116 ss-1]
MLVAALTAALALSADVVRALPQAASSSATAPVTTSVLSETVSTVVPSPTASLTSTLPSQVPLPPKQDWCPSEIFCAGELLQTVNVAQLYADPKTFVDKPTAQKSQQVVSNFQNIGGNSSNVTVGAIVDFVNNNFKGEGLELEPIVFANFNPTPSFLNNVSDPLVKQWSQIVHGYWAQLIRSTNDSALCPEGTENGSCESTLIPLNHTFVVPGGRFREQYYWDSYWIVQGLLVSELHDIVNATLQNFMDELEHIGFIPNGGRIYYLNRSQPPLFIHMLTSYVQATNDTSILRRALPLAEKELAWWSANRSVQVKSPYTNATHTVYRYHVTNTAPRPESYYTDYITANDPTLQTPLTKQERGDLYAELATGAESGWDYSSRWLKEPTIGGSNNTAPALRSLNIRSLVPVDLNSILYKAHLNLAALYNNQSRSAAASNHTQAAIALREAIIDLHWDSNKRAFYDFNLTSNARNDIFTVATFYPFWNGIIPDEVLSDGTGATAFGAFATLNMVLNRYNGTYPVTFLETGLQWDAPNAWPPHQHIIMEALRNLPSNITSTPLPSPPSGNSTYALIPAGQIGIAEEKLPGQVLAEGKNATKTGPAADINTLNGTVVNGGNATSGESWAAVLQRELANRYIASALCSWHATGGEVPNLLPRLPDSQLQITQSQNNTGNMFEKFSINDIDSAGRGGEYTVQAGFGWTNGVVLYLAHLYGDKLVAPSCPNLVAISSSNTANTSGALAQITLPSVAVSVGAIVLGVVGLVL